MTWAYEPSMVPWALFAVLLAGFGLGAITMIPVARSSAPFTARRLLTGMVGLVAAMFATGIWFREPMHDIGLLFDSHGRWGCIDDSYLITDSTVTLLLFVPLLALFVWRGIVGLRRAQLRAGSAG